MSFFRKLFSSENVDKEPSAESSDDKKKKGKDKKGDKSDDKKEVAVKKEGSGEKFQNDSFKSAASADVKADQKVASDDKATKKSSDDKKKTEEKSEEPSKKEKVEKKSDDGSKDGGKNSKRGEKKSDSKRGSKEDGGAKKSDKKDDKGNDRDRKVKEEGTGSKEGRKDTKDNKSKGTKDGKGKKGDGKGDKDAGKDSRNLKDKDGKGKGKDGKKGDSKKDGKGGGKGAKKEDSAGHGKSKDGAGKGGKKGKGPEKTRRDSKAEREAAERAAAEAAARAEAEAKAAAEARAKEIEEYGHKLEHTWVLWVLIHNKGAGQSWSDNLRPIHSFKTVEEFWQMYKFIHTPRYMSGADYCLFKEGVAPAWEDERCKYGGRWIAKIDKLKARTLDSIWDNLVLSVIGETMSPHFGPLICGIVVSTRSKASKISLWVSYAAEEVILTIGKSFIKLMQAQGVKNTGITYTFEDFQSQGITHSFVYDPKREEMPDPASEEFNLMFT